MKSRQAFTLIELLVVMAAMSILILTIVQFGVTVLRNLSDGNETAERLTAIHRLGRDLRESALQAESIEAIENEGSLDSITLALKDGRIEYRIADPGLLVTRFQIGEAASRDAYQTGPIEASVKGAELRLYRLAGTPPVRKLCSVVRLPTRDTTSRGSPAPVEAVQPEDAE